MPARQAPPTVSQPSALVSIFLPLLFFALGLVVQMQYSAMLGLIPLLIGFWLPYHASWEKDPHLNLAPRLTSGKRWVAATTIEIAKLEKKITHNKELDGGCTGCFFRAVGMFFCFVVMMIVTAALSANLPYSLREDITGVALVDLLFIGMIYVWFFAPRTWTPHLIEFKLPVYEALLEQFPDLGLGKWTREYQFELAKTESGEVPVDLKLSFKPSDAPPTFIGVQGQVAINRGGPYLYFVIITRTELPILAPFEAGGDVLERKPEKDVNILVIRQFADKRGGYQTTATDHLRLLNKVRQAVQATLKA